MALISIGTTLYYPCNPLFTNTQAPGIGNSTTIDAAGEYHSVIFVAREAMTISYVGFTAGSVAGSPTADLRIETVDASGLPSGALWATNTNIVTGTLTNGWNQAALTAAASIAAGDKVCVKVVYNSGTSFIMRSAHAGSARTQLPYIVTNTGSPAKAAYNYTGIAVGSGASAFYYVPYLFPMTTAAQNAFSNSVAGAKRGLRFKVPMRCRCVGIRIPNGSTAGADFNLILSDDGGSELSSSGTAYDGDISQLSSGIGCHAYYFDNPVILSKATWYRVAIEPTAANNVNVHTITVPSASYVSALGWDGGNAHYTTYTTAGGWIDTATDQVPFIELILDQIDDGTGGGAAATTAYTFA